MIPIRIGLGGKEASGHRENSALEFSVCRKRNGGEERPLRIVSLSSPGDGAGLRRDIPGSQKLTMYDRHAKSGTVKFIHLTIDLRTARIPEAQSGRR